MTSKALLDMNDPCHVWRREDLAKIFLEDVQGGIPLAAEQMNVLLRTVRHAVAQVDQLLDLGCGDGILGRMVLGQYAEATGVFLDFSEPMIEAAKKKADLQRDLPRSRPGKKRLGAVGRPQRPFRSRAVGPGDSPFARRTEERVVSRDIRAAQTGRTVSQFGACGSAFTVVPGRIR